MPVLLLEDSLADARLLQHSLRESVPTAHLVSARDTETALRLLESGWRPDLVLLDLGLPGRNGIAILETIKGGPDGRHIPVVVVSGSHAAHHTNELLSSRG